MILSRAHDLAFVHIPKCAGSSVRQQIADIDDCRGLFGNVHTHPALGKVDMGHIPLRQLEIHFPDHFATLRELESFAICRDPLDRFGSSLRQTLWMYDKRPMTLMAPDEVRDIVRRVVAEIDGAMDDLPHKFAFFARQADYTHLRGEKLVDWIAPIEDTAKVIEVFSRKIGRALDTGRRANQNVRLKYKWLGGVAFAVNDRLSRLLPQSIHQPLKAAALKLLSRRGSAAEEFRVAEMPEVVAFVERHYAQDREIHRAALVDRAAMRARWPDA